MIWLLPFPLIFMQHLFGSFNKKDYFCGRYNYHNMTEIYKSYRLTSQEEPTDEMLQALMEDVAKSARESSERAEAEKKRRLQEVASQIDEWRNSIGQ